MIVEHVVGQRIHTKVSVAGKLSNNKGINRLGGGFLSAPALRKRTKPISLWLLTSMWIIWRCLSRAVVMIFRVARELARAAGSEALIAVKSRTC